MGVSPAAGAAGVDAMCALIDGVTEYALAETISGLYKTEVIHRRGPWRSFEAVEFATLEWVDWFNSRRLLEPIGNIPPAEAEARYYAMLEEQPIGVTQTKWPPANPGRFTLSKRDVLSHPPLVVATFVDLLCQCNRQIVLLPEH
jgi:hypothetical protein